MSKYADRDGILWLGTGGYGINKYNTRRELFHTDKEDAFGFREDAFHNLFVAFRSGACLYDPLSKTRKPIVPMHLMHKEWINPVIIHQSADGSFWLFVSLINHKGYRVLKYNTQKQTIEDRTNTFADSFIARGDMCVAFFNDHDNNTWQVKYDNDATLKLVEADKDITKLIAEYTLPISKQIPARTFSVYQIQQDASGNLWLATNKGLYRLDPQKREWKIYKNNPANSLSLSSDAILSLCPDPVEPNKFFWIGTNGGGLNKFEIATGNCKIYSEEDGLPNNVVYGILNDGAGNLWMSTNKGLSCFTVQQASFRNFTTEDGLPGNEFNGGQYYKRFNGDMIFGGVNGITWFNPAAVLAATLQPNKIVITSLSIFNKPIDFKKDSGIINKPIQYVQTIILPHEKNMFSIEFALLQYTKADKKQYKYKLDGFNKDWIDNGSSNSVIFTNLEPRTYTLHIIGCNSDGVWTKDGESLKIIILPAWYQTWWFRLLILLTVAGGLYAIYKYRLKQQVKLISMRNKIASDLHDEIGSTLSSISVYSDIIEQKTQDDEMQQIAERISNSSRNTLTAMSDIVWSINPKNDQFDNIILRMKTFSHEILQAKNCQLHFEAEDVLNNLKLHMNERKNFYLIFKEALNNTVKYASAKNVFISLALKNNKIFFSLKDDGIGFDINDHKEGNGLENMQRRAKDLKGELSVISQQGKGTKVELIFGVK